jgi:predicted patatin/cPLA2 family phospholipase
MKQFKINDRAGLILEGGGMRGVFTSGVLDCLMDRGIEFPYTIGVSAGACSGLSYMSHQRGRSKHGNIDLLKEYKYIGLRHLLTKGNIMDFKLLFHIYPEKIYPYDYDALAKNKNRFEIVTTSCLTGKPCYYDERQSPRRIIDIVKASSSMPFVSPIVEVDGQPMLDGGIADSIPLMRAMQQGYENCMVVLTRNRGYRKPYKPSRVPFFCYRKYPAMRKAIMERNAMYNQQIEQVERLEEEGKLTVLRPVNPIVVDRIERDCNKLLALYNEGYNCANEIQFL